MNSYGPSSASQGYGSAPARSAGGCRPFLIALAVLGSFGVLICGGGFAALVVFGTVSPDTKIYTGNEVPKRFLGTMREVGALEPDEQLLYFYSDAAWDIRDGFYFVSDRKVAVYSESSGDETLLAVPFDEIVELDLQRDTSFLTDSEITLVLPDGRPISFPVSSEGDRDVRFHDEIRTRIERASAAK